MLKTIIVIIAILLSVVIILVIIKRYTKSNLVRFPKGIHTVSSLRYHAYSIIFEGQECTLKGVCTNKSNPKANIFLVYIAEDVRGAYTKPIQCSLALNQQANFDMVNDSVNLVVVGKITFTNGEVLLKETNIISL